ncbi:MAG: ATP-binding cassette domain-containing protein [Bacilli bacterium]|nr:ATP-binding cassette domain-containing protein [Bacilli bacterium]
MAKKVSEKYAKPIDPAPNEPVKEEKEGEKPADKEEKEALSASEEEILFQDANKKKKEREEAYKVENKDREVILSVSHLREYFKLGGKGEFKYNKAVHDVSFDVYKGEVFGLVGESGCGKTTIGRTIIRLYKPTSGDVYFKGVRIGAGTRWNEKEIKYTRIRLKEKLKEFDLAESSEKEAASGNEAQIGEIKAKFDALRQAEISKADAIIDRERKNIIEAKRDNANVDKDFSAEEVEKVKQEYASFLERTNQGRSLSSEEDKATFAEYKKKLNTAKHAKITSGMQMIFQDPMASINPRMTVRGIISEGLRINGVHDKAYIKERVNEMLDKVGLLPEHADRYPHEFSGGQRQRIGIARALIMNPELIIADEPVSALDVSIQAQIINLLNDLRDELGLTILFIAHNLSVVKYFCDRIAVMYFGNLVELAPSDELFRHPLHPYTKSLLSAVQHCDPDTEKNRTRIKYNPAASHDYSEDKPALVEIEPGHFVRCNKKEEEEYRALLASGYDSGYGD